MKLEALTQLLFTLRDLFKSFKAQYVNKATHNIIITAMENDPLRLILKACKGEDFGTNQQCVEADLRKTHFLV